MQYAKEFPLSPSCGIFLYLSVLRQAPVSWKKQFGALSICVSTVKDWQPCLALPQTSNVMQQYVFLHLHSEMYENVNINYGQFSKQEIFCMPDHFRASCKQFMFLTQSKRANMGYLGSGS